MGRCIAPSFIAHDRHKYEHELLLARRRAEELLAKEQEAQRALLTAHAERDRQRAVAEDRALFGGQMMAIVSHDLRNPLSVIRMSAQLIGAATVWNAVRRLRDGVVTHELAVYPVAKSTVDVRDQAVRFVTKSPQGAPHR